MQVGGSRRAVSDPAFLGALEDIQDLLISFQAEDGGVELSAAQVEQLQQVTATLLGMPTDYPDAETHSKLTDILTKLNGTINVDPGTAPTDYPDSGSHTRLETIAAKLDSILGETGDNGTILDEISAAIAALPTANQTDALTDEELRATPVPVEITNPGDIGGGSGGDVEVTNFPTDFPDAATLLKLEQIRVLAASLPTTAPQTNALTDAQLRANPVPVSGTVAVTGAGDATAANQTTQNTKLDTLHTDNGSATTSPPSSGAGIIGWLRGIYDKLNGTLAISGSVSATNTPTVVSGTKSSVGAGDVIAATATIGPEMMVHIDTNGAVATATLNFEGSNDGGTTWFRLLGYNVNSAAATATTGGTYTSLGVVYSNQNSTQAYRVINPYALWRLNAATQTVGTVRAYAAVWPQIHTTTVVPQGTFTVDTELVVGGYSTAANPGTSNTDRARILPGSASAVPFVARTTTGSSSGQDFGCTWPNWAMQIVMSGVGTVTACKCRLEGTLGTSGGWFTIATWDTAAGQVLNDIVFVNGKPLQQVRVTLDTLTVTGTAGVNVFVQPSL